ncbi:helix-turn-helix domain-containing protein [Pseudoclavibacter helvolus]|uniref:helix-turn-helix domain-containing protein n=1 Tax=Pseudoclavibacter helvolus TaxID=255205 RepID=UPI003C761195
MTYLTVDEAAEEYRRHPDTIRKALKSGELQGHQRVPRGKWLTKPEWVDEWLEGPRRPTLAALRAQKRSRGR